MGGNKCLGLRKRETPECPSFTYWFFKDYARLLCESGQSHKLYEKRLAVSIRESNSQFPRLENRMQQAADRNLWNKRFNVLGRVWGGWQVLGWSGGNPEAPRVRYSSAEHLSPDRQRGFLALASLRERSTLTRSNDWRGRRQEAAHID